jgi:hypothetical protein
MMSPSMIVALIALFVALGGTAYATQTRNQKVLAAEIVTRVTASPLVAPGGGAMVVSLCPTGYRAIGGGAQHIHDFVHDSNWELINTGPKIDLTSPTVPWWQPSEQGQSLAPQLTGPARGWGASMRNVGRAEGNFTVAAVCARVVVDQR